ncbi:MAG: AmmeMemoRadiSam system radical SAM enzyme [Coriobacteriia bacterium]|nr:AmmeMemoRadiSam system radical SAM enzyme [Coriobacteriia bacterium]
MSEADRADRPASPASPDASDAPDAPPSPPAPDRAVCPICPQACRLRAGQLGNCGARVGARVAAGSEVRPAAFGRITALALDPIEKKPLARFWPGSQILSVGGIGCNLHCPFCQNAEISQCRASAGLVAGLRYLPPEDLVAEAVRLGPRGNIGVAYTYNEPFIAYEYLQQSARLVHAAGLLNVVVSNGYINAGPLRQLLPLIDAANIDLKAFRQSAYDQMGAPHGLERVQQSIELLAAHCHLEVTTLIVPGLNDDAGQITEIAAWLASINKDIPLHITRFHPAYKMLKTPAPARPQIFGYVRLAERHLNYVYAGNI